MFENAILDWGRIGILSRGLYFGMVGVKHVLYLIHVLASFLYIWFIEQTHKFYQTCAISYQHIEMWIYIDETLFNIAGVACAKLSLLMEFLFWSRFFPWANLLSNWIHRVEVR